MIKIQLKKAELLKIIADNNLNHLIKKRSKK